MSTPLQFTITDAGKAAVWNNNGTGLDLVLTHVQIGSGRRAPNGSEEGLVVPMSLVAIESGSNVTPTQIRMTATFSGDETYEINEIGVWAGEPGKQGALLFCYWSQIAGSLAKKFGGVDFVFTHDMVIDSAIPGGSITVAFDQSAGSSAIAISIHENALNPHPQYMTESEIAALLETANGNINGSLSGLLSGMLPLAGGTMTGAITLSADASMPLHPVTKQQLDAAVLAGSGSSSAIVNGGDGLGVGQKIYNLSASRPSGTNYQNTTGKPIFITFACGVGAQSGGNFYVGESANMLTNPVILFSDGGTYWNFIIPKGFYYGIAAGAIVDYWLETR